MNSFGAAVTIAMMIWSKWQFVPNTKNALWVLKDLMLGLSLAATIMTLMSVEDVRSLSAECAHNPLAKAVVGLDIAALVFFALYIIFRFLAIFTA